MVRAASACLRWAIVPGRDDGSAQFNPGLTAESVGETEVVLENGESGDTVTFTVEVVPRAGGY